MPNFYLKRFLSLVLSMLGVACCALAATLPPVVGEAVMVIGVANISPAEGVGRPIARGDAVREGDRIETDAGGHGAANPAGPEQPCSAALCADSAVAAAGEWQRDAYQ